MGDRGNIVVRQGEGNTHDVYLYTHWCGSTLLQTTQAAMKRGKDRLNDPQYFARILFDEMTCGHVGGLTGFGITCTIWDNEHELVVLDMHKNQVAVVTAPESGERLPVDYHPLAGPWGYEEFMNLTIGDDDKPVKVEPMKLKIEITHTKGPWHVNALSYAETGGGATGRRLRIVGDESCQADKYAVNAEGGYVCTIDRTGGCAQADARLIAAAPELFALVRAYRISNPIDAYTDMVDKLIARISGERLTR